MSGVESFHGDLSLTGVRKLYERAVEHFDNGDFRQAEAYLEWLIEQEPRHAYAYWYLARVKEQKGESEQALFYWKTCALLNDGRLDWVDGVYTKLVDSYGRARRWQELYEFLLEAERRDRSCRSIPHHLAATAERLGRKEEAVSHLTRCLALGGEGDAIRDVQERLVALCFELGDLDTLREAARTLREADPLFARAHYLLSRYYEKRGHLNMAIRHLRKCARVEEGAAPSRKGEIILDLATLYRKAGKPREALRTLRQGGLLTGAHPYALWLSAECHEEMGDPGNAIASWRRAAEAFGPATREGREAFFAYVEGLMDLGREEEARSHLERAPDQIRQTERARRFLAEAHERTGDLGKARALWEEILAAYPAGSRERSGPLMSLVRILLSLGHAEEALGFLGGESLDRMRDPDGYVLKAQVHEDLGQEELALMAWEKAEAMVAHDRRQAFDLKLSRAELLLRLARPADALALLSGLTPRHGREERFWSLLGQALSELGDLEQGLQAWERLTSCPRPRVRAEGLRRRAELLRDLGRLEEAAADYQLLISEGHDMRAGLLGLAEIAEERHDLTRAVALWEAMAEMYESSHALSVRARARAGRARDMARTASGRLSARPAASSRA